MSIYDNLDSWPIDLLIANDARPGLKGRVVTSDPSLSGLARLLRTDGGGFWTLNLTGVNLWSPDQIRLARAMSNRAQGGVTLFDVPSCECAFAPWPTGKPPARVPFSDGTTFDDGTLFTPEGIDIVVFADAALRATTLRVMVNSAGTLKEGMRFSILHPNKGERFYDIDRVTNVETQVYDLAISPPLREDVWAEPTTVCNFSNPTGVMSLVNAEDAVEAISLNRLSSASFQFREA